MRQKVQIKTEIMANQNCTIDKLEKIWQNHLCQRSILHHLLRNASEFGDERGQTTTRIHQTLERTYDRTMRHAHRRHFNYTIRSWAQASCLGIQHYKVNVIEWLLCHTPRDK